MEFPGAKTKTKGKAAEPVTARFVRDQHEAGVKPIRQEIQDYWLNHAFLHGHQWLWYNPQTRALDEIPRDPERVQATYNRIWPNSRIIVSKALQREFTFEVIPSAADDASIRGAKLAESVVRSIHDEHDWEALREAFYWTVWKGGTVGVCIDWDPDGGQVVAPEQGDSEGEITGGDTVETVLSIAEMSVQPGVRNAETALWWVKSEVLPPQTVQGTYGMAKEPAADATAGMSPFQQKMIATHTGASEDLADLTLVLTYYERPNPQRPEGAIAVVVGDEVVQGPLPWPFPWKDRLNLVIQHETPDENRWTGSTVLTMVRPIQVAYNAAWSSVIEHMKQAGNARLMVPQSSIDLIEHWTDLPGEMVPYADGMEKPSYESPPQMPAWWVDAPRAIRDEIDDTMGVHDISRGEAPVNIESGYGLSVLAEQDTTPVGKMVKASAVAFGKIASFALRLYAQEVKAPRTAVVRTPSQPPETSKWTGKDLIGQTHAEIPQESVMPRNRAAMVAQAEKLVEMGLVTSFEQFATVSEMPGHGDLINRLSPDIAKARRENHMMALGKVAIPASFDAHDKHIPEHNDFRKSPRYEMLPPEGKAIFEDHLMGHETMAAEEMGRARAKAAVDPMLAATPSADGTVSLAPEEVPPGAAPAGVPTEEAGLPPEEGGMPLNEEETMPGAPTMGTVVPPPGIM